jgi:hypothetical protein
VATKARNSAKPGGLPDPKDVLKVQACSDKSVDRASAELSLSAVTGNTITARTFARGTFGVTDLTESVAVLTAAVAKVNAGDLSGPEAMLTAQACALDAIFTELARRAALNMSEHINAAEIYLRLALKAQAQCRTTVEALVEMKNPRPVAFVSQANISSGPQQVNNATPLACTSSRPGNFSNPSNELLEVKNEDRLDIGAAGPTGKPYSQMEAVGAIHRTKE